MSENASEYHIGSGAYMNIQTSAIVKLNEQFIIYTEDGPVTLTVEVSADFAKIDKKHQLAEFIIRVARTAQKNHTKSISDVIKEAKKEFD
jgi:hypothetical protein